MHRLIIRFFLTVLLLLSCSFAYADFDELSDITTELGLKSEDHKKIMAGKILTVDLPETTDKMLSQALVLFVPASADKIADLVFSDRVFISDIEVLFAGRIDPNKVNESMAKLGFSAKESGELKLLQQVKAGDTFNLSSEEISQINKSVASGKASAEDISSVYRNILAGRVKAYLKSGIAGVAPYDRGNGAGVNVANELGAMAKAASLLSKSSPGLYRAFIDYPNNQSLHIEHDFYWVKRTVQDRPNFVLQHRIIERRPDGFVLLKREFFSGHSYNASQLVIGAFTVRGGTLVFTLIRSTTDQVAGFMSKARHRLGRDVFRVELLKRFKALRAQLVK